MGYVLPFKSPQGGELAVIKICHRMIRDVKGYTEPMTFHHFEWSKSKNNLLSSAVSQRQEVDSL